MSAIGGVSSFNLPSPWQQLQTMDAAVSNATSGNTDSNATIVSMLSGGSGSSASDTVDAISSAMASAQESAFQGYADLAAQAALNRVQAQAKAAQAQSPDTTDTSAADTSITPDPLNTSDPTNPFATQAPVTLDDGTVINPPTTIDLGNGVTLDPTTGITKMADGTQVTPYGVPVKEISTLPVDLPPGFNVDVTA